MTKGTLKDARHRIGKSAKFTVKNTKMVGRLLGNYLWGETYRNAQLFVVKEGDKSRTYTRDDIERIVEQVMKDVELVEVKR